MVSGKVVSLMGVYINAEKYISMIYENLWPMIQHFATSFFRTIMQLYIELASSTFAEICN